MSDRGFSVRHLQNVNNFQSCVRGIYNKGSFVIMSGPNQVRRLNISVCFDKRVHHATRSYILLVTFIYMNIALVLGNCKHKRNTINHHFFWTFRYKIVMHIQNKRLLQLPHLLLLVGRL